MMGELSKDNGEWQAAARFLSRQLRSDNLCLKIQQMDCQKVYLH